ncbi:MAG: tripartite tricarboxylate transporter substrate-binding protein [Betaproteobacteria bacterium]
MSPRIYAGFVLALAFCSICTAQQYPSKPIKIIVPFPVGGIADIYSRLIGNRWTELWGQPVVIENRTGAGGNIGADLVAKAAPDGYTIGIGSIGTHAVNVTLFSKMPFDPVRDFAPISLLLEAEGLLVLHPSVPAQSVAELIALARPKPGGLTFASAGTPPDIVRRLNAETDRYMRSREMETRLTNEGARFIPMTPEQFGDFVKAEIAKWAPVVRASGAKAD